MHLALNNNKGNISDIHIDPVRFIAAVEEWLQNATGMKVRVSKRKAQKILIQRQKRLRSLLQKANLTGLMELDEKERKIRFLDFMTKYLSIIFNIPEALNPLEILKSSVSNFFEEDKRFAFLQNTHYQKYKKLLFNLVERLYQDLEKYQSFKVLSRGLSAEQFFEISQHALSLSNTVMFLARDHRRLNGSVVRKYVAVYRDLGTYMEKIVRILVAVQGILRGKHVALSEINKFNTNNNVEKLKADPYFRGLLSPFNVAVWNACRHARFRTQPSTKEVKFVDNQKSMRWSYSTLKQQTCELYAAISILSHLENALNLYAIQKLGM
jgi:hypothetical protein